MTAILIIGKGQRVICNIIHIQKGKSSLLEKMGTGTMGGRRFTVSLLKTINAKLHILAMSRHPEPFIMRKNVSQPKKSQLAPSCLPWQSKQEQQRYIISPSCSSRAMLMPQLLSHMSVRRVKRREQMFPSAELLLIVIKGGN